MRPLSALVLALALLAGATAGSGTPSAGAVSISLSLVTSGLERPVGITHAGDGSGRLFIVEQTGKIRIIDSGGALLATEFIDLSGVITATCGNPPMEPQCNEQGLLGLAFHPDYATNGYFYVNYTNNDLSGDNAGDTVIARYECCLGADPDRADTGVAPVTILTIEQPYTNHNAGHLQFGPDGYLYIAMGDGGAGGDPQDRAQDPATLLGKMLRIDVDGGSPYAIPPDNPYVGPDGVLDEIWAFGLRNPWRFSFDRLSGQLFTGDVGQGDWEEIDMQWPGEGALNYGWDMMEGLHCYEPTTLCDDGDPLLNYPAQEYSHSLGCSVTGGYRYRGAASNTITGVYFYADYCSGRIWGIQDVDGVGHFTQDPGASPLLVTTHDISTFGEDEAGEIYLAHHGSVTSGAIYKVTAASGTDADDDGFVDTSDNCSAVANPLQTNSDANFIDVPPPRIFDDLTWPNSDTPGDACDSDDDNDGLSDAAEVAGCNGSGPLSPTLRDTDGDRTLDNAECVFGTDPADAGSKPPFIINPDGDLDGIPNALEATYGTNASDNDSDDDRVLDGVEVRYYNTDPLDPTTDADVCNDAKEIASVNNDTLVSAADLSAVAQAFGNSSNPNYTAAYDANKDGLISAADLSFVAQQFGGC